MTDAAVPVRRGGRRPGPIGVDFAEEAFHLAQMRRTSAGAFETVATSTCAYGDSRDAVLEDPRRLKRLLKSARSGRRFSGREVVASMPPERVRTVPVSYSVGQGEPEQRAFLTALAERVEEPLEQYIVDYIPIRLDSSADQRLAVAILVRRQDALEFLEQLRRAGLDVVSLEIGPLALRRYVTALMGEARDEVVMIINFGQRSSYLTVLSGRRLVFDQQVEFGEAAIVERLVTALDVSPAEALQMVRRHGFAAGAPGDHADVARVLAEITRPAFNRFSEQIHRAVVFAVSENRGRGIGRVYIGGSLARMHGTSDLLSELLHLPTMALPDPAAQFPERAAARADGERPELAVAVGLALKHLVEIGDVELIPADYRAARQQRRLINRSAAAAGVGIAACALATLTLLAGSADTEQELRRLQEQRAATERLQNELASLDAQRSALLARSGRLDTLRTRSATVALFQALDRALVPGQLWLLEWAFDGRAETTSTMSLRGEATDHAALSRFVRRLLQQAGIGRVDVVRTAAAEYGATAVVAFEISVALSPPEVRA